jgi:hypothetical protein
MTTIYQVGYEGWVEPPLVAFINKQAAIDHANELCQAQSSELTELGREHEVQILPEEFCKEENAEYSIAIMVNETASYCYWVDAVELIG